MHVQQIEFIPLRDFRHPRGERQAVRRVMKQRILRDFDFVIVNARNSGIEPDRVRIRDEVHLVAAIGQFQTQFCGDDAAAAVRRIAGDSDPHGVSVSFSVAYPICPFRFSAGSALSPPPNHTRTRSSSTNDGGIADHLGIPRLVCRCRTGCSVTRDQCHAIARSRQAQTPIFLAIAARCTASSTSRAETRLPARPNP